MVVVHEVVAFSLEHVLDSLGGVRETGEDGRDVVTLLHRDDTHLILLVHPDEEIFGVVMEDTTSIRPMTTATGGEKESRIRLLEEVSVLTELRVLGGGLGRIGFWNM